MFESVEHVHLIGIGGAGMSAIARVLNQKGTRVSGSDRQLTPLAADLMAEGVQVFIGHAPENIRGATLVVRSSAIPESNVEVKAALDRGIPVLKRDAFLSHLLAGKKVVAVAGSHGKTTTTAMIAWILTASGKAPSFIVGGVLANLGTNAQAGDGPLFVIEADEYDRMFLGLHPDGAVITNIEHDHPDCYPTAQDFEQAFADFMAGIQPGGILVACSDDPGVQRLLPQAAKRSLKILTYGFGPAAYQAVLFAGKPGRGCCFDLLEEGHSIAQVCLAVPGRHNVLNAMAAFIVCKQLGVPEKVIADRLSEFQGTGRRFEVVGQVGDLVVIDDYAHHPTEIAATLAAARQRYPGSDLWVVWQPHTYSRITALWDAFRVCFKEADHLFVTPVYAARETRPEGFELETLVSSVVCSDVRFGENLAEIAQMLLAEMKPGSVLLTLSAGDADRISQLVLQGLKERRLAGGNHER